MFVSNSGRLRSPDSNRLATISFQQDNHSAKLTNAADTSKGSKLQLQLRLKMRLLNEHLW